MGMVTARALFWSNKPNPAICVNVGAATAHSWKWMGEENISGLASVDFEILVSGFITSTSTGRSQNFKILIFSVRNIELGNIIGAIFQTAVVQWGSSTGFDGFFGGSFIPFDCNAHCALLVYHTGTSRY